MSASISTSDIATQLHCSNDCLSIVDSLIDDFASIRASLLNESTPNNDMMVDGEEKVRNKMEVFF